MPDTTAPRRATDVDRLVDRFEAAGCPVRPAEAADQVDGEAAAVVVRPTDTAATAAVVGVAAEHGLTVVARGTGSRLGWGAPPRHVDVLIDTAAMDCTIEHAAGDLVVHAQAGVRLVALQDQLATARQRLALDPLTDPGADGAGSIGGVIATAADGPLRLSHGAVRDLLIGITIVRADGTIAKAGGKVVKNVAGYDLGKLFTGSYGTLGVITEAVFRLHPLPDTSRWVVRTVADPDEGIALALGVVRSQAVPTAVELDRSADGPVQIAVLLDGIGTGVAARADAVAALVDGEVSDSPPPWWGRAPWPADGTALRLTAELTGEATLVCTLAELPVPVDVRGSVGIGKLHAGFAAATPPEDVAAAVEVLRTRSSEWGGQVVVLRAPAPVRALVDTWGPVGGLALMRRVKHEFDPTGALAPGRFVGGI